MKERDEFSGQITFRLGAELGTMKKFWDTSGVKRVF